MVSPPVIPATLPRSEADAFIAELTTNGGGLSYMA
jgi:hypothetical protein